MIDSLPYLNAVVMESLRLVDTISSYQTRVVPPGGCVISGYFLPAGVCNHFFDLAFYYEFLVSFFLLNKRNLRQSFLPNHTSSIVNLAFSVLRKPSILLAGLCRKRATASLPRVCGLIPVALGDALEESCRWLVSCCMLQNHLSPYLTPKPICSHENGIG